MHHSYLIVDPQTSKQRNKNKQHSKTDGLYITCPLIQSIIGFKKLRHTIVYKSISTNFGGDKKQSKFLDSVQDFLLTVKSINISQISNPNQNVRKKYRQHYRIDIKQYLKRAFLKQAYEIPIQAYQVLRLTNSQNKTENDWKTQKIYICKPYYLHGHLRQLLDSNSKAINKQILKIHNVPQLLRQLLKCSVEFGGLDNFVMTTQNVYFQQNMLRLKINYTSFTGLSLIKAKSTIGPLQFVEICPYLTPNMLLNGEIGLQQKIRFFLVNCLSIIAKQNFTLAMEEVESSKQFNYEEVARFILTNNQISQRIAKQFQSKIKHPLIQKRLQKLQALNIRKLLIDGLVKNQPLSWERIVSSICIGSEKYQFQRNKQHSELIKNAFIEFHKVLFQEDQMKKFYILRNLQSPLLYIPIRFHANLTEVFKQKAWWDLFNIKDVNGRTRPEIYNFENSQFAIKLLNAALRRYQVSQKNIEKAKQFKDDVVIKTLLQYLELDSLILMKSKQSEGIVSLKENIQIYRNLKV